MKIKPTLFTVTALGFCALSANAQMATAPTTATPTIPGMMPGTTPGFVTSADNAMPMPNNSSTMPMGTMGTMPAPMPGGTMAMDGMNMISAQDQLFVARAAEGNLAEITLANLALSKSKNANVRQTAQVILMGHTKAQNELMALMPMSKMPMLSVTHMAVYDALQKAKGADFDKMYMAGQTGDHENTIALFDAEVKAGQQDALKGYASKYLPDIIGHTILIYNVAKQVKAPGSELRPQLPPVPPGVTPSFMGAPVDTTNYDTIVMSMNQTMMQMNKM